MFRCYFPAPSLQNAVTPPKPMNSFPTPPPRDRPSVEGDYVVCTVCLCSMHSVYYLRMCTLYTVCTMCTVCTVCTMCTVCTVCTMCTLYTVCTMCTVYTVFTVYSLYSVYYVYTLYSVYYVYSLCNVYYVYNSSIHTVCISRCTVPIQSEQLLYMDP